MDDRTLILNFLRRHQIGVISTVDSNGRPESAVVGFAETPGLELTFATSINSRKAHNILANPSVAFVAGWDELITVQYEGRAQILSGDELDVYQKIHFAKIPVAKKYAHDPEERYFVIKPIWIRYTDLNTNPWKVVELI